MVLSWSAGKIPKSSAAVVDYRTRVNPCAQNVEFHGPAPVIRAFLHSTHVTAPILILFEYDIHGFDPTTFISRKAMLSVNRPLHARLQQYQVDRE